MKNKTAVISVGGSLIVPNEIDLVFLKKFRDFIEKEINEGYRFVIVAGGGWTAREYQNAARNLGKPTELDLDMLGIHATRINAFLLKTVLGNLAHPKIILNPPGEIKFTEKILIAAEENPGAGATSDYGAVKMAEYIGTTKILNLTNIRYVYNKNPLKFPDAFPIKKMTWQEFKEILSDDWESGGHAPFGPVAAEEARKKGFEVAIIGGNDLAEAKAYLDGGNFEGTLISK